jgi:Flp pilus assembly protein TadG
MIEFVVVASTLFFLLFVIADFGLIFYNRITIYNAAREGARWASINNVTACTSNSSSTPTDPCQVAYTLANKALINATGLTVGYTGANSSKGTIQTITVSFRPGSVYLASLNRLHRAEVSMYHE